MDDFDHPRSERPDPWPAPTRGAASAPSARDWILVDCGPYGVRPRRLPGEAPRAKPGRSGRG